MTHHLNLFHLFSVHSTRLPAYCSYLLFLPPSSPLTASSTFALSYTRTCLFFTGSLFLIGLDIPLASIALTLTSIFSPTSVISAPSTLLNSPSPPMLASTSVYRTNRRNTTSFSSYSFTAVGTSILLPPPNPAATLYLPIPLLPLSMCQLCPLLLPTSLPLL